MASAIPSLLIFLVLLVSPYLGSSSYHTSYTHGGKHYAIRSNSDPRQPKQNPTCRPSSSDGMPVPHRLSPCSPHRAAAPSEDTTTVADVFHRDALRLRSLFGNNDNHGPCAPTVSARFQWRDLHPQQRRPETRVAGYLRVPLRGRLRHPGAGIYSGVRYVD
ncbi:unnamed protein product [Urochloa humidicola]